MEYNEANVSLTNITDTVEYFQRVIKPNLCNFPFKLIQKFHKEDFFCLVCFSHFRKRKNGLKHARLFHKDIEIEAGAPDVGTEEEEIEFIECPACNDHVNELLEHWLTYHSVIKRTGCLICTRQFITFQGFQKHKSGCQGKPSQDLPNLSEVHDICGRLTVDIYLGFKTVKNDDNFVDFLTRNEVNMISKLYAEGNIEKYVDMAVTSAMSLEVSDKWLFMFIKVLKEYLSTLRDVRLAVMADSEHANQIAIFANVYIGKGDTLDTLWLDVWMTPKGILTLGPAMWIPTSMQPNCVLVNDTNENARGDVFWKIEATQNIMDGEAISLPDYSAHRLPKENAVDCDTDSEESISDVD